MKYIITNVMGAITTDEIECSSIEEAIDNIEYGESLCHSCASRFDLHDGDGIIVEDEDGNELYNDTYTRTVEIKNDNLINLNTDYIIKLDKIRALVEDLVTLTEDYDDQLKEKVRSLSEAVI